jgi:hypothetical protein
MSTRPKDLAINDALLLQAQADVPLSGYDVTKFYILPTQEGQPAGAGLTADDTYPTVDGTQGGEGITPKSFGYTMGYLTGDQYAPNGLPVTPGVSFPLNPVSGDYACAWITFPIACLDSMADPGSRSKTMCVLILIWQQGALTQRASFVNNTYTVPTTDMGNIPSRQSLSEILKPLADNGDQGGNLPPNPRPPGR